jgi:2',3'-cyclic-nucleotide 2'-phosphodiesterase/3'-nucleotidase
MDYLKSAIASYKHPVVLANILTENGQSLTGRPYQMFERDGLRIAVLGLDTQYIPHWEQPTTIRGLTFNSALETAKQYVPQLRQMADAVVVTYHGGFERDLETGEPTERLTGENEGYALLHEVPGIDALVTGHQHREIAQVVNGIPTTQPGYRGANVAEISLELEKDVAGKWTVTSSAAQLHPVGEMTPDSEIVAMMAPISKITEDWLDTTVGTVVGDMTITDPMAARLKEHPYIEFINKVQMEASGAKISGTSLFNNDGRGFNPTISFRDVITNYVYPNTLAVERVTGLDLRNALELTATYLIINEAGDIDFNPKYVVPKPQFYNYDMYEGIEYTLDISKPMGERVTRFELDGAPIADDQELEIVINQYRAVGGGNYTMFDAAKIVREVQIDMTELIGNYLKAHPVIEATVNNNFEIVK